MTPKILEYARAVEAEGFDRIDRPSLSQPRFRWEHYVPRDVLAIWSDLSLDARLVAYIFASELRELDSSSCSSDFIIMS
jgi:hypothetical protein